MSKPKSRLRSGIRIFDIVIIFLAAAATTGAAIVSYGGSQGSEVYIKSGADEWLYPLDIDRTVRVPGIIGDTVIEISDDSARVVDSDCRDKICVHMGELHRDGDWAACLPNGVMIRVSGRKSDEVDAITY